MESDELDSTSVMAQYGIPSDVIFARMHRDILRDSREITRTIVAETDNTAVWIVGLASALLLAAVADPHEARRILGSNHFWTVLLLWLSILMGVTYKVSNLTLSARALKHFFSLEAALVGYAAGADVTDGHHVNVQAVNNLVAAYLDSSIPPAQPADLNSARANMRAIRVMSRIVSVFFACCPMFFAWATFLIARGLWIS